MMNEKEQYQHEMVKQKVEVIAMMLKSLSENFDFHFSFNFALLSPVSKNIIGMNGFMNSNLNTNLLNIWLNDLIFYKDTQEQMMSAIAQGRLMAVCVVDDAKPEGIVDWIEKGRAYEVEHIYTCNDSTHNLFKLKGMDAGKYKGYKSERFVILFNQYNAN